MSDKQDFSDIGEKIQNAIQDAIASGDFGQINIVVKDTVGSAMDEVRKQVNQVHDRINRSSEKGGQDGDGAYNAEGRDAGRRDYASRYRSRTPRYPRTPRDREEARHGQEDCQQPASQLQGYRNTGTAGMKRYFSRNGKVAGILYAVFGGIGFGGFGLIALILLIVLLTAGKVPLSALILFSLLTAGFAVMLGKGCGLQTRLKRAERYLKLVREDKYMKIEDLAARTGQSARRVRKDIRKMIQAGNFPEGHLDEKETVFVLDDETWEQYLTELKQYREKQRLEESGRQTAKVQPQEQRRELTAEEQIEKEGHAYMDRLRELNVQIPGEVISNKLYQLDYLLRRIFQVLKEHPEKCPQMRKFMDYYLPTTVKLVESYADFDKAGVQGDNIMTARAEIEKTMDTISQAFEKLLDDMYQDAAFEAAADAKVLKTVLAQDGFMKSEFNLNREKEGEQ